MFHSVHHFSQGYVTTHATHRVPGTEPAGNRTSRQSACTHAFQALELQVSQPA